MRAALPITSATVLGSKCTQTATSTSAISTRTRNTARGCSFGSVWARSPAPKTPKSSSSTTKAVGGAGCPMARANTIDRTVILYNNLGDIYIGEFKNGLKHGKGVETYANGDFYEGDFINGLCEGSGTYLWKDGSEYNGDFKQGYRNGYGIWKNRHRD